MESRKIRCWLCLNVFEALLSRTLDRHHQLLTPASPSSSHSSSSSAVHPLIPPIFKATCPPPSDHLLLSNQTLQTASKDGVRVWRSMRINRVRGLRTAGEGLEFRSHLRKRSLVWILWLKQHQLCLNTHEDWCILGFVVQELRRFPSIKNSIYSNKYPFARTKDQSSLNAVWIRRFKKPGAVTRPSAGLVPFGGFDLFVLMYRGLHQSEGVGHQAGSKSIGAEPIPPAEKEFCCAEQPNALQVVAPQGSKVIPTINIFRMQNSAGHKCDARPPERLHRRPGKQDGKPQCVQGWCSVPHARGWCIFYVLASSPSILKVFTQQLS